MKPTITKQNLAMLIDAYAAAKATENEHLVQTMATQLTGAIDSIYSAIDGLPESDSEEN